MNFTNKAEGKYEELGWVELVGIESWQNFGNSKFLNLAGLKLRPYLYVKVEIVLKNAKGSRYHQLTSIWIDLEGYHHYQVTKP